MHDNKDLGYHNTINKRPASFKCHSRISAQVNLKKFNKHPYPIKRLPSWEGTYLNIVVFVKKNDIKWKQAFWMLLWETASMCVLLGNESEKATATKLQQSIYIYILIVFSVLPKFYEKMNKRPLLFSAHLK